MTTVKIELPDDQAAALNAKATAQGVSAEEYARQALERDLAQRPRKHISEIIIERTRNVPREEFEKLPKDGASEHDHYLYGSPKRNQ